MDLLDFTDFMDDDKIHTLLYYLPILFKVGGKQ